MAKLQVKLAVQVLVALAAVLYLASYFMPWVRIGDHESDITLDFKLSDIKEKTYTSEYVSYKVVYIVGLALACVTAVVYLFANKYANVGLLLTVMGLTLYTVIGYNNSNKSFARFMGGKPSMLSGPVLAIVNVVLYAVAVALTLYA